MSSKIKQYEEELLDYLKTDKLKSKKFTLYPSSKYPQDKIQIITRKNNEHESELFIQRVKPDKSPEIISKIYKYNGKESAAFEKITIQKLIKDSKQRYLSNYLDSVKYNNKSPKTSPKSSNSSQTLEERIANSHMDIKEQILEQLKQLKVSPGSKDTRSEINKEFKHALSYNARLNKLAEHEADTLENAQKQGKKVVDILGNFTLKKLDSKYHSNITGANRNKHNDILSNVSQETDRLYDESRRKSIDIGLTSFEKYDSAKKAYLRKNPGATDFDKKVKLWEDKWNIDHNIYWHFEDIQDAMEQFKEDMINYDPKTKEETKQKIESFLKLKNNIKYKDYVDYIHKLPLSVKAVMRAKY